MATRITSEILQAYLNCKFKAHLKLMGQQGIRSDYEAMMAEIPKDVREKAINKILARNPESKVVRDISLTVPALREGPSFVLDANLKDDQFMLTIDGLKRVDGPSKLGDFHYVPMLFHESRKVGKQQRLLLEVQGLLLFQIQGTLPAHGVVWHGQPCNSTKVRLSTDVRKAERLVQQVKGLGGSGSDPRSILNAHCHVCEFRRRCHDQAVQADSISLLKGMGEKELRKLNRKGIFTIAQLSCTFRLRKRAKRVKREHRPHYFALQAAAIRDKKIYVLKPPPIPIRPVRIYFDIEGNSERSFAYLVGMIIDDGETQTQHSL
jgi:predicted RecB family nuclease